jgi:molecular chaperone GrpE
MIQLDPEENSNSKVEPETTEVEDVEVLKQALAEEQAKAEANLAGWQRAQADFTNYRRRSEQEREESVKFANSLLMLDLLPILDDLERALVSIPARLAKLSWVGAIPD